MVGTSAFLDPYTQQRLCGVRPPLRKEDEWSGGAGSKVSIERFLGKHETNAKSGYSGTTHDKDPYGGDASIRGSPSDRPTGCSYTRA